jgi:hypothetical protein
LDAGSLPGARAARLRCDLLCCLVMAGLVPAMTNKILQQKEPAPNAGAGSRQNKLAAYFIST